MWAKSGKKWQMWSKVVKSGKSGFCGQKVVNVVKSGKE